MAANTNFGSSNKPGVHVGDTPPEDPEVIWIYTGSASNAYGVSGKAIEPGCEYYNTGTNISTGWTQVNVTKNNTYVGSTPPDDVSRVWIYTGSASNTYGVSGKAIEPGCEYYNTGSNKNTGWTQVNVTKNNTYVGSTPPDDVSRIWIYTGSDSNTYGVSNKAIVPGGQYYNTGSNKNTGWTPVKAIWG